MEKQEIETIINWSSDESAITVYSLMPKIWRKCMKVGKLKKEGRNQKGRVIWKEYEIPLWAITFRSKRVARGAGFAVKPPARAESEGGI